MKKVLTVLIVMVVMVSSIWGYGWVEIDDTIFGDDACEVTIYGDGYKVDMCIGYERDGVCMIGVYTRFLDYYLREKAERGWWTMNDIYVMVGEEGEVYTTPSFSDAIKSIRDNGYLIIRNDNGVYRFKFEEEEVNKLDKIIKRMRY